MTRFDPKVTTPEALPGLADAEFRMVVDADLRRRRDPQGLPEGVSKALRSPENLERWRSTLQSIVRFAEAQIRIMEESISRQSHEGERARLEAKRASTARFRSVVLDYLTTADTLAAEQSGDNVILAERDNYARRVLALEHGIRAHRKAAKDDLLDDEGPASYETTLWALLDD